MDITTDIALLSAMSMSEPVPMPLTVSEILLEAPGPKGALRGTLLTPHSKPATVVLIVPGSGPTDRDGNNPLGVSASPYQLLAEGLAAKGFATLRIDKRGMFASASAIDNANAVTIADYVDDIRAWVKVLKHEIQTSRIWMMGHSEGGLVTLAAAQEEEVCGAILIATPGRPMGEVLRGQFKSNPANAPLLKEALPIIDALEHRQRVDATKIHPALQTLFHPAIHGFLIDAFSYNPSQLISTISKPVLVLQGQRDLQVEETDARRLKIANPQVSLVILPTMNHVMKEVTSDNLKENLASYADSTLPLVSGLIELIESFIIDNTPRSL